MSYIDVQVTSRRSKQIFVSKCQTKLHSVGLRLVLEEKCFFLKQNQNFSVSIKFGSFSD